MPYFPECFFPDYAYLKLYLSYLFHSVFFNSIAKYALPSSYIILHIH